MRFISDETAARHRLPQSGQRCVWMEAGLLSYLLCDRSFDCDRCPLDAAMRNQFSAPKKKRMRTDRPPATRSGAVSDAGPAAADGRAARSWFTPDHLRVNLRDPHAARLSIESGLSRLLPPVKTVILPRAGHAIAPGAACGWLVFEGGTLPIRLPFGATVTAVNGALEERPHLICSEDPTKAWLFDFAADDAKAFERELLDADAARTRFIADLDTFRALAAECLQPRGSRHCPTLPDGGRFVDDLSTLIGPVIYLQILRRGFLPPR